MARITENTQEEHFDVGLKLCQLDSFTRILRALAKQALDELLKRNIHNLRLSEKQRTLTMNSIVTGNEAILKHILKKHRQQEITIDENILDEDGLTMR